MTKKIVYHVDGKLAEFRISGDHVDATYYDQWFEDHVEHDGIASAEGVFRPADGRRFFDALAVAFCNSSRVWVEDEQVGD